jgi:hypothetical protein
MARQTPTNYTQVEFVRFLHETFPTLDAEIAGDEGLLHLQMHTFARHMRRVQAAADWSVYRRGVHLAQELLAHADAELMNALKVSFLEHISFEDAHGAAAWAALTRELQAAWQAMKDANDGLLERAAARRQATRNRDR